MIFRVFPCILKHHGSVKYLKYIILSSRQKGYKAKEPAIKVFASSASVCISPISENAQESKSAVNKANIKNIIKEENVSLKDVSDTILKNESKLEERNSRPNGYLFMPVTDPDVTVATDKSFEKSDCEKDSSQPIKLLNTVKPSDLEWHKQVLSIPSIPRYYKSLSKFRLTGLVVFTTLIGYSMAPGPFEPISMICLTVGTGFASAAANAVNQILEVPYDSQMERTKHRVLISGVLTPLHAFMFAACSASLGLSVLYFGTNALTAALGATNLILYTSIYTPLKRCSIVNTWLGSIVGAIPPLMGWAACCGTLSSGALLMGAILYAWQFPHFNALSWNLRPDYSRAGYRMTSVIDPGLCRRSSLRHSIALLAMCSAA
ncbi:Protoheme IX farnesyltransferase, mitochondrial, partial [Stegodyphus mimosarum]